MALPLVIPSIFADELTRTVQDQLQAQGYYSGAIDGKPSEQFKAALRQYQAQHHLPTTGLIDKSTAKALDDEAGKALPAPTAFSGKGAATSSPTSPTPTVTSAAAASPRPVVTPPVVSSPSPSKPEMSPSPVTETPLNLQRITQFIRDFLHAGESSDISLQLRYFHFPVDYFAHGRVTESYMRAQRNRYLKLWPTRNYSLVGPVSIKPVSSDSALVDFTLSYRLQRGQHRAAGRRGNRVTLRLVNGELKIVAIRERSAHR